MANIDDWQRTWDSRQATLEGVLGKSDGRVLHARMPFNLGGQADVLIFRDHLPGRIAATCELLGEPSQKQNSLGTFELAVAEREDSDWGPTMISHLARYTCERRVGLGNTMDLGNNFPTGSTMAGLLFAGYKKFEYAGNRAGLLLCVSITQDEITACRAGQTKEVFTALKAAAIYPYSDLFRKSVSVACGT
jgi:hypothetical protein